MTDKQCSMCKQTKPIEAFGKNRKGEKVIVRSACKSCTNAKKKSQRDANPEKVKEILRRSYQKHRDKRLEYARKKRQEMLVANPASDSIPCKIAREENEIAVRRLREGQ